MMSEEAMWKAIDALREQTSVLAQGLAVVKNEQQQVRNNHERLLEHLARIESKQDDIRKDYQEAKGGIRFGKWLAGIGATLSGVAVAAWAILKNGGAGQ